MSNSVLPSVAKLAFAGLGAGLAGPLGAACCAVAGEHAGTLAKYVNEFITSSASTSGGVLANYIYDKLKEFRPDGLENSLADALRRALRECLAEIAKDVGLNGLPQHDAWFRNWDSQLARPMAELQAGASGAFDPSTPESDAGVAFLVQLDARARVEAVHRSQGGLGLGRASEPRPLPPELAEFVLPRLSRALGPALESLLRSDTYHQAWLESCQLFQRDVTARLGRIESKIDLLGAKFDDISPYALLGLKTELERTTRSLTEQQALVAEWVEKYRDLERRFSADSKDERSRQALELLRAGQLEEAAALLEQVGSDDEAEVDRVAARHFERGKLHELRFAPEAALEAYRQAFQYRPQVYEHGFALAFLLQKQNHHWEAAFVYEKTLSLPMDEDRRAGTLNNLANLYRVTQRMAEAEGAYWEALEIRRKLAGKNPDAYLPDVAMTLNNLANLCRDTQRMAEAERANGEALEIRRKLTGKNPDAYLPDVAGTLNNLANLYSATQRMAEAERACGEALEIYRKLAGKNPDAYLPDVAMTLNNLANLCRDTQRMAEAERANGEACAIREALWQRDPRVHGDDLARCLWARALIRQAQGQPANILRADLERALQVAYALPITISIENLLQSLSA